jgi:hypothetical protein
MWRPAVGQTPASTLWCNSLLKESLWNDAGGTQFAVLIQKLQDGTERKTPFWKTEVAEMSENRWVHWRASDGVVELLGAKAKVFKLQRGGAQVFWALSDWQKSAGVPQQTKWLNQGLASWSKRIHEQLGIPSEHIVHRKLIKTDSRFTTHTPYVSTHVLVHLLSHWHHACKNTVSQDCPLQLLQGLLQNVCKESTVYVSADCMATPGTCNPSGTALSMSAGLATLAADLVGLGTQGQGILASKLISSAKATSTHTRGMQLFSQLLNGVSLIVDESLLLGEWPTSPLDERLGCLGKRKRGEPLDPDVVDAVSNLEGSKAARNSYQVSRLAKGLGMKLHAHTAAMDMAALRKYMMACRRAFANKTTFCISLDAKRFGGRHWIAAALHCADADQGCWCPPQAISG